MNEYELTRAETFAVGVAVALVTASLALIGANVLVLFGLL